MKKAPLRKIAYSILFCLLSSMVAAESLSVVSYNVESGGAEPGVISMIVEEIYGIDIWGFSEVREQWRNALVDAAGRARGADFDGVLGTTGGADRLLIAFNSVRFELVTSEELNDINQGNHRAPLVVHLRQRSDGMELLVVVNHLARANEALRHTQATKLNAWGATSSLPVLAMGDYNFDWHVVNGDTDHDDGFDNMTSDGVFEWIRPDALIRTQCNLNFNSVLDFVFFAGAARSWPSEAQILRREPSYCDLKTTHKDKVPDHRPLRVVFETN